MINVTKFIEVAALLYVAQGIELSANAASEES